MNTWDDPVTPAVDPNGWVWYPDSNGQLYTQYFDEDGNDCMMWDSQEDGSFYWVCADIGYSCRDIGVEGRRGIFYQDVLVGTMILDDNLTVVWLYDIGQNENHENHNDIIHNDIIVNDINDISDFDSDEDDPDP